MKSVLLTLFLSLKVVSAFSQKTSAIFSNKFVDISYFTCSCSDSANGIHQQKIMLVIQNKTHDEIEVSFDKSISYNGAPHQNFNQEQKHMLILKAKEVISGNCYERNKALYIFSHNLNGFGRQLTGFSINNVSVTKRKNSFTR